MMMQICNALALFIAFLHFQLYKLNSAPIPVNSASVIFTELPTEGITNFLLLPKILTFKKWYSSTCFFL